MNSKKYSDPSKHTRWAITFALVVGGALAGAAFGIVLTPLGKILAGAPPADFANYRWNAISFAIMGAVLAPVTTWAALREVPLWRTVVEPLAGAFAGAALGLVVGSVAGLLLMPIGGIAAAIRLVVSQNRRPKRLQ